MQEADPSMPPTGDRHAEPLMNEGRTLTRGRFSVAHVISTGGLYGAEKVLLELAAFACAQGWHSDVVALDGRGVNALVDAAHALGLKAHIICPTRAGIVTCASGSGRRMRHSRS